MTAAVIVLLVAVVLLCVVVVETWESEKKSKWAWREACDDRRLMDSKMMAAESKRFTAERQLERVTKERDEAREKLAAVGAVLTPPAAEAQK